jgi:hypothetical protein
MAIDTRNRRASVLGYTVATLALPHPDGAITVDDRYHATHTYAGTTDYIAYLVSAASVTTTSEGQLRTTA